MARAQVAVLISGRGSNLSALLAACQAPNFPAEVAVVLSNRADAPGIEIARAAGVPALTVPHGTDRRAHEAAIAHALLPFHPDWVALAGYMRVLTPFFLDQFPARVLNIHPSLLPAFPGVHAVAQALRAGVRWSGATVHLVAAEVDMGPILLQGAVPVHEGDDEATLAARILTMEHRIYPLALRWAVEGRVDAQGRLRPPPGALASYCSDEHPIDSDLGA